MDPHDQAYRDLGQVLHRIRVSCGVCGIVSGIPAALMGSAGLVAMLAPPTTKIATTVASAGMVVGFGSMVTAFWGLSIVVKRIYGPVAARDIAQRYGLAPEEMADLLSAL